MKEIFRFIYRTIRLIIFGLSCIIVPPLALGLIYFSLSYSFENVVDYFGLQLGANVYLWKGFYFVAIIMWICPIIYLIIKSIINKFKPNKVMEKPLTRSQMILIDVMMERKEKRENEKKVNENMQTNN